MEREVLHAAKVENLKVPKDKAGLAAQAQTKKRAIKVRAGAYVGFSLQVPSRFLSEAILSMHVVLHAY